MPRALTSRAVFEAQRENSDDVFLVLVTILMEGVTEDIRVVNNTVNVTSRGVEFIACPFSISLPDDMEQATTSARITIDNVDTRIWQGVRALGFAPEVMIEVVMASAPDEVALSTVGLRLRDATATRQSVEGTLVPDSIWQSGYPEGDFDPPQNQGLFGS